MPRFCRSLMLVSVLAVLAPGTAAAQDVRVVARDVPLDAARASVARTAPLGFTMVGIHWQGSGRVWFRTALRARRLRPLAAGAAGGGGPAGRRQRRGRRPGGLARRQPLVDGAGPLHPVPRRGRGVPPAHVLRRQPGDRGRQGDGRDDTAGHLGGGTRGGPGAAADHHPAWRLERGRDDRPRRLRRSPRGCASRWCTTRRAPTAIRRPNRRRSCAGSSATTSSGTAGTTSATTSSSTSTAGCSRDAVEGSPRTSSAPTPGASTPAASASPSSATTTRPRSPPPRVRPSRTCSPGGSTSGTSIRARRSTPSRPEARAGRRARTSVCVPCRATATRACTSCPGAGIYGKLGSIALNVTGIGLPKLYDPEAEGGVGELVRFTGRLSASRAWLVEVKDAAGAVVAQGSGTGRAIDWTWDASAVPIAYYTYTISAGPDVRPSTLPVPGPPPLAVTGLSVSPSVLTPNGDWAGEAASVRFGLTRRATLGVRVVNATTSGLVRTLLASAERPAGTRTMSWDGRDGSGTIVPDGHYRIEVTATDGAEQVGALGEHRPRHDARRVLGLAEPRLPERRRPRRATPDRLCAHARGSGQGADPPRHEDAAHRLQRLAAGGCVHRGLGRLSVRAGSACRTASSPPSRWRRPRWGHAR